MRREDRGQPVPMARRIADAILREMIEPRPITSRMRTGRAFFIDTFENYTSVVTEKWEQTDGTIALATDYPKQDLQCLKLTTGANDTDEASATLNLGAVPKSRYGVEIEFMNNDTLAKIEHVSLKMALYDGAKLFDARVYYLAEANKKWQYRNSAAVLTDITGGAQHLNFSASEQPCYNNLKLVVDFLKEEYAKLICNEKEFSLSGLALNSSADTTTPPHLEFCILIRNGSTGAIRTLRVDNVILTDMEP